MPDTKGSPKYFEVDARTVINLGRDSIKDNVTALIELVKNSYDADATVVEVEVMTAAASPYVRIADNGVGMTESELDRSWLRIGYSQKTKSKRSKRGRRKTGEKGIGRLSADRLGASLRLRSRARGETVVGLDVEWNRFDSPGMSLTLVPVDFVEDGSIQLPKESKTGTELKISGLRQSWTLEELEDLHQELSILTSPFTKTDEFQIVLSTDVEGVVSGPVDSPFMETAEVHLMLAFDGKSAKYSVSHRGSNVENSESQNIDDKNVLQNVGEIPWANIASEEIRPPTAKARNPVLGPARVELLFYPRKSELLRGTGLSLGDLRSFLDRNAGVKIYRDGIRVRPYGDPLSSESDWLGLSDRKLRNPAGAGREDFRVGANQVVGAVFISRDENKDLTDSASREGLVHEEAFFQLRSLALYGISLLETEYHRLFVLTRESRAKNDQNPKEGVRNLGKVLKRLDVELGVVADEMPRKTRRAVSVAREHVESARVQIMETSASIEELVSQATVSRGLATIGIAAAVFGHETQSAIDQFIGANSTAGRLLELDPPEIQSATGEVAKAKKYAAQVAAWGSFALKRVGRDKRRRRKLHVERIVDQVVKDIRPVMVSAGIEIEFVAESVVGRVFAMDVEAIAVNLLTNAYAAVQLTSRRRRIRVEVSRWSQGPGVEVLVGDSGPGVAKRMRDQIWSPLFTTRVDGRGRQVGTGLGLSIVNAIVQEAGGERIVEEDPKLGGALFRIRLAIGA